MDVHEKWGELKSLIKDTANEILGLQGKTARSQWYDIECERALAERNEARMKKMQRVTRASVEEYANKRRAAKKICRQKKRMKEKEHLQKLQDEYNMKNTRKIFKGIKMVKAGFTSRTEFLKDEEGRLIAEQGEMLERWNRHFQTLLNEEPGDATDSEFICPREEDLIEAEVPPDIEEIVEIISLLKNNKSPGIDDIPAELIKYGGNDLHSQIHQIIWEVWTMEEMPEDWNMAVLCPIHKKGDKLTCNNYRGIALLSTTYKVLSAAISRRLQAWTEGVIGEYQCGFRKGRSTIDHIFSLRQMIEKTYEYDVNLHHLFIDFKQAYDSVNRPQLLKAMVELGIPKKLVRLVAMTLRHTMCRVKVMGTLSAVFEVLCGLRQGDPLSTELFNIDMEKAARAIRTNPGGTIYNRMTQHLAYADDWVISARTKASLEGALEEFERASRELGLKINEDKTVYIRTSRNPVREEGFEKVLGHNFPICNEFKYLGSMINSTGDVGEEIKARLAAGNRCLCAVQKILRLRCLTTNLKKVVYKTIIRPVVTYGSETWTLTAGNEKILRTWERKILRRIYGPIKEAGTWRIRKNAELRSLYNEPDLISFIKKGRLRWLGHVERMSENRIPRRMLYGKPGGSRKRGRPRMRWLDDVEDDLRALEVRRWRTIAADRDLWKVMLEEAQVL